MMTRTMTAEKLFGPPTQVVLVNDQGPAVSFTGWKLGSSEATCAESGGAMRTVSVEILYSNTMPYVVAERSEIRQGNGETQRDASVKLCRAEKHVRSVCETPTGDVVRDMARATALDHAITVWPWLAPTGRRSSRERSRAG